MGKTNTRRRGESLDEEIFEATYLLLQSNNPTSLTFSEIAKQAKTSRTVLYRRWASPIDLTIDAIAFKISQEQNPLVTLDFDKGSLQNNLIYAGTQFLEISSTRPANYVGQIYNVLKQGDDTISKKYILNAIKDSNLEVMDYVFLKAINSGEINKMPTEIVKLAFFELLRSPLIDVKNKSINEVVGEIVKSIILPAVK